MDGDAGLVMGETLVDLFPTEAGPLSAVTGFEHRPGGAPANVAVGLAALDTAPVFWTCLGDDAFADFLADTLREYGVPGDFVERRVDAKTALAVVTREPNADRSFTFYDADTATFDFSTDYVPDAALAGCEWVHVGGVALVHDGSRKATLDLVDRARDAGCLVSFDPNPRPALWTDERDAERVLGAVVERVDVVFTSDADLALLGVDDGDPDAVARSLRDRGPDTVFLTRGREGATVATGDGVLSEPAFSVDTVDTTGAGDAFTAAALARYEPGLDEAALRECLRFANAAAALTTTATGAMRALPTATDVRAFLTEH